MSHSERKTHSKRGTRTCGWGGAQKHRGAGHRGGKGNAGSSKHNWMHVSKYNKEYFGRKGFNRNPGLRNEVNTINIGDLNNIIDTWVKQGKATQEGAKIIIDLSEVGVGKLLGAGDIDRSLEITVTTATEKAKNKVTEAGGSIIITQSDSTEDSSKEENSEAEESEE